ncbi:MAG: hypothetical protein OXC31_24780 [Spirochaetaceae bacterium]|nr:hypothetical protein [Spirochaetaceae bacterium]
MKAIQVMFDEALLARLDASEEVRREGRSAVLRRAAEQFLHRMEQRSLDVQYRKAYEGVDVLGEEFSGWEHQGAWPAN